MHSNIKEITDRSAKSRRTMKGRDSATSFSSILLDKSVILYNPEDASAVCPYPWTRSTGTFLLIVSEREGPPVGSSRLREERRRGARHLPPGPAGERGEVGRVHREGE